MRQRNTPFDEMFQIVDALTLEYHRMVCQTRVIPGASNPLIPLIAIVKEKTLRDHGWTNESFAEECRKHIIQFASYETCDNVIPFTSQSWAA